VAIRNATLFAAIAALWPAGTTALAEPHAPAAAAAKKTRSRVVTSRALPALDGRNLKVSFAEVSYEPGGSSAPHSHPCPVIGYVIEGAIRMRIKGEPEAVYRAGESFYEAAGGVHEVSANVSAQAPAKLLAMFVCDRETPLSLPPPMEGK
jgi:quercetin dioxygenase-like cupin family protein